MGLVAHEIAEAFVGELGVVAAFGGDEVAGGLIEGGVAVLKGGVLAAEGGKLGEGEVPGAGVGIAALFLGFEVGLPFLNLGAGIAEGDVLHVVLGIVAGEDLHGMTN